MKKNDILVWLSGQHESMLQRTLALSAINSGSGNLVGLQKIADYLSPLFNEIADQCDLFALPAVRKMDFSGKLQQSETGKALVAKKRPDAPLQILLCGHMDTVFAKESDFQQHRYIDENTINGPGLADMKGGLMVMLTALQAFEQSELAEHLGWTVVINPDEETGSLSSADLLAKHAKQAHAGLVYEPALADGTLAGARKGSGNFAIHVTGRAAHAGREFNIGRNAISALAKIMVSLDQLNHQREGVTLNLGKISGGSALNAVADEAVCHFNIRTLHEDDEGWAKQQINEILESINNERGAYFQEGINANLHGQFNRSPKAMSPAVETLFAWLRESSRELNITIRSKATGGCCDGNNLAKAGLPNIDTLGVRGGNIHTDQEFLLLDSLTERAKLSFLLLQKLAGNVELAVANKSKMGNL